jgi:tRNA(Ile)-lysidine synthase
MKGYKLVSDYLTDRKRNYFQRQSQLVLEDASGEIVWLVGERVSSKAAITTDTIKCLTIRYY